MLPKELGFYSALLAGEANRQLDVSFSCDHSPKADYSETCNAKCVLKLVSPFDVILHPRIGALHRDNSVYPRIVS